MHNSNLYSTVAVIALLLAVPLLGKVATSSVNQNYENQASIINVETGGTLDKLGHKISSFFSKSFATVSNLFKKNSTDGDFTSLPDSFDGLINVSYQDINNIVIDINPIKKISCGTGETAFNYLIVFNNNYTILDFACNDGDTYSSFVIKVGDELHTKYQLPLISKSELMALPIFIGDSQAIEAERNGN